MAQLKFVTLDVFTTTRFAGNPLAVVKVPAGVEVPDEKLQAIAREFNLSETVFLYAQATDNSGRPEWRVRIFLTDAEVPFAGHPVIGAACHAFETLHSEDTQGSLICNAGRIGVHWDGVARTDIPHNVHIHTQNPCAAADVYAFQPALTGHVKQGAVAVVSAVRGMTFVLVELPDLQTLAKVEVSGKPQPQLDDDWNTGFIGAMFYVANGTAHDEGGGEILKYRTRMVEGHMEDPATGSASCALASYLALKNGSAGASFEFTQGVEMGRKSDIHVEVTLADGGSAVRKVELSGRAVKVMEGVIDV